MFIEANHLEKLKFIQQTWEENHSMHPQRYRASLIFTILCKQKYLDLQLTSAIQIFNMEYSVTDAEIFDEVKACNSFYDPVEGKYEEDWKKFLRRWLSWNQKGNPLLENHKQYVAFGIVSQPNKGLSTCQFQLLLRFQEKGIIIKKSSTGDPESSHVLTSGCTITGPHIDSTSKGHVLGVSIGQKLVFWWDPIPIQSRVKKRRQFFARLCIAFFSQ